MPPLLQDNIMVSPSSPAHAPHNPLSIRTSKQQSKQSIQQAPSSSSSQQPRPEYPIKIPPEKQARALELYNTLKMAEYMAENEPATHNDGYLLAPSTARSVKSQTSSKGRGAPSTSASMYDTMTDYGSVVSFDIDYGICVLQWQESQDTPEKAFDSNSEGKSCISTVSWIVLALPKPESPCEQYSP
jgi:hypothetical protein